MAQTQRKVGIFVQHQNHQSLTNFFTYGLNNDNRGSIIVFRICCQFLWKSFAVFCQKLSLYPSSVTSNITLNEYHLRIATASTQKSGDHCIHHTLPKFKFLKCAN